MSDYTSNSKIVIVTEGPDTKEFAQNLDLLAVSPAKQRLKTV